MSTAIARVQSMNRGQQFQALSLRAGDAVPPIDPFLGVDHAWMSAATFPPHPHAGFSAVSYLFVDSETGIRNRDSRGNDNVIVPGGLHWTAAGRGVVHEEVPVQPGKTVHMLQIFVNLSQDKQSAAPFALGLAPEDVPVIEIPGVLIRVPLGSFGGVHSPLQPPTEVTLLDALIDEGAELSVPLNPDHNTFILPVHGTLTVDGDAFDKNNEAVPVFPAGLHQRTIQLRSRGGAAAAVVFSGSPLRQPVHWQGSLALASQEALSDAMTAYRRGAFGKLP